MSELDARYQADDFIKAVSDKAKESIRSHGKQSLAHRWDHVKRVYDWCLKLVSDYPSCDIGALQVAALLHDVCQPYDNKKNHVLMSSQRANEILEELGCSQEYIRLVVNIIKHHSTEDMNLESAPLESRILFDADKIDGFGAIGIARVFIFCGQQGIPIEEVCKWYRGKLALALEGIYTEKAKKQINDNINYVYGFIKDIESQVRVEG